jgi:hypothetical protein
MIKDKKSWSTFYSQSRLNAAIQYCRIVLGHINRCANIVRLLSLNFVMYWVIILNTKLMKYLLIFRCDDGIMPTIMGAFSCKCICRSPPAQNFVLALNCFSRAQNQMVKNSMRSAADAVRVKLGQTANSKKICATRAKPGN